MVNTSFYQIGLGRPSRYSAQSSYLNPLFSRSQRFSFNGLRSVRSQFRQENAYNLLLSKEARTRAVSLNQKRSGVSDYDAEQAKRLGLSTELYSALKRTNPNSELFARDRGFTSASRSDVARSFDRLFQNFDVGLNTQRNDQVVAHDLPDWLSFDSATNSLVGTPPEGVTGTFRIKLTATNDDGQEASDYITIKVGEPLENNAPPTAQRSELGWFYREDGGSAGVARVGERYSFVIPAEAFSDSDVGDSLSFSTRLQGSGSGGDGAADPAGQQWPEWLYFDRASGRFFGTPPASEVGKTYTLDVIATDSQGHSTRATLTLGVKADDDLGVEVVGAIPTQVVNSGAAYRLKLNLDQFIQHPQASSLAVDVLNSKGGSSGILARITAHEPSRVVRSLDPQAVFAGEAYRSGNLLNQVLNNHDAKQRFQVTSANAPAWLTIDQNTGELSVDASANPVAGTYDVRLTIDGPDGAQETVVRLQVNAAGTRGSETSPFAKGVLDDVAVSSQGVEHIQLPANVFGDAGSAVYSATQANGEPLPAWLTIDPATGTLTKSGSVDPADQKQYAIKLVATNGLGQSASVRFHLDVRPADVQVHTALAAQTVYLEDGSSSLRIPPGTFASATPEDVLYTARLSDGSALPDGVVFDPATQTFQIDSNALRQSVGVGPLNLQIQATDQINGSVATLDVVLNVLDQRGEETAPQGSLAQLDLQLQQGVGGTRSLSGLFGDDDSLVYSLRQADGTALPSWLTFDPDTKELSGTPPAGVDSIQLQLLATDQRGRQEALAVNLEATDYAPQTVLTLDGVSSKHVTARDLQLAFGEKGSDDRVFLPFTLISRPEGSQVDTTVTGVKDRDVVQRDLGDQLDYRVEVSDLFDVQAGRAHYRLTLANGEKVPDWLNFRINHISAPQIRNAIQDQALEIGHSFALAISPGELVSDDGGDDLRLDAALADGRSLPSWLVFDKASNTLRLADGATAVAGTHQIRITATDHSDAGTSPVSSVFSLTVHPSGTGVRQIEIKPGSNITQRQVSSGGNEVFNLPLTVFDAQGSGALTYSVVQRNGEPLPSWLSFDPSRPSVLRKVGDPPDPGKVHELDLVLVARNRFGAETAVGLGLNFYDDRATLLRAPDHLVAHDTYAQTFSFPGLVNPHQEKGDGARLGLVLTQSDGSNLPVGVTFDPKTVSLKVDPRINTALSTQSFDLKFSVTNPDTKQLETRTFRLSVLPQGGDRTLSPGDDAVAYLNGGKQRLTFSNLAGAGASVTGVGGASLPGHLRFDPDTGVLTVDPAVGGSAAQDESLRLTYTDPVSGQTETKDFVLQYSTASLYRAPPTVVDPVGSVDVAPAGSFSVALSRSAFSPPASGESYEYRVTRANGDPLPSWLNFDPATRRLSGTPPASSDPRTPLRLALTAQDDRGATATDVFEVYVRDQKSEVEIRGDIPQDLDADQDLDLRLTALNADGQEVSFALRVDLTDPPVAPKRTENGDVRFGLSRGETKRLDLNALVSDANKKDELTFTFGGGLPPYARFDPDSGALIVQVPTDAAIGDTSVVATATDPTGNSVSIPLVLAVSGNLAPIAKAQTQRVDVRAGQERTIELKGLGFSDPDDPNGFLRYRIEPVSEGGEVPSFVSLKSDGLLFKPTFNEPSGAVRVAVVATDSNGAEARSVLTVHVESAQSPRLEVALGDIRATSGVPFRVDVPASAFSGIEDGQFSLATPDRLTAEEIKEFQVISNLIWDEVLRKTDSQLDFDDIDEVAGRRIVGYLQALDVLSGGDGSGRSFDTLKRSIEDVAKRADITTDITTLLDLLPFDAAPLDPSAARDLIDVAKKLDTDLSQRVFGETLRSSVQRSIDRSLERVDSILGIDTEAIRKANEPEYTPSEGKIDVLSSRLKELVGGLFVEVLGSDSLGTYGRDIGLSRQDKQRTNTIYNTLIEYLNLGGTKRRKPTVSDLAPHNQKVIAGLLKSLDYFTGGDGKKLEFKKILAELPSQKRKLAEKIIADFNASFSVDSFAVPTIGHQSAFTAAIELRGYLQQDKNLQLLNSQRINELVFQLETSYGVQYSPNIAKILQAKASSQYANLLGVSGKGTPLDILLNPSIGNGISLLTSHQARALAGLNTFQKGGLL